MEFTQERRIRVSMMQRREVMGCKAPTTEGAGSGVVEVSNSLEAEYQGQMCTIREEVDVAVARRLKSLCPAGTYCTCTFPDTPLITGIT